MLGLMALGLTSLMIYHLVKNALMGKQLSKDDEFQGTVELLIPVTSTSHFYPESWSATADAFQLGSAPIKIHVLIDGHHPSLSHWQQIGQKIANLEIHSFPMRPVDVSPMPWMIAQVASKLTGNVIIIGDPEITPTLKAFASVAKYVKEKIDLTLSFPSRRNSRSWVKRLALLIQILLSLHFLVSKNGARISRTH